MRYVGTSLREVKFMLDANLASSAKSVALTGSFNNWDTSVHRLTQNSEGTWSISLILVPGTYPYLFIVDGHPYNDPLDDGRMPSEWGGSYSVRVVR